MYNFYPAVDNAVLPAVLSVFPQGRGQGTIIDGAYLSPAVTHTRASEGRYFNSAGVLTTAGVNEVRRDHDPATLLPRGILREGAATNIMTRSEAIGSWSVNSGATVTSDTDVAPDGLTTMDTLNIAASTDSGVFRTLSSSITSGAPIAVSCFVKYKTGNDVIRLGSDASSVFGSTTAAVITYNWTTNSFSSVGSQITAGSPRAETVGFGIRRISFVVTPTATGTPAFFIYNSPAATVSTWGIWGFQVEVGNFVTSYIPTTAATATRAADNFTISNLANIGLATPTTATVFCEFEMVGLNNALASTLWNIDDGSAANRVYARINPSNTRELRFGRFAASSPSFSNTANVYTLGSVAKSACAFAASDYGFTLNSGTVAAAAISVPAGLNRMTLGDAPSATESAAVWLRRLVVYPPRLPNTTLQAL